MAKGQGGALRRGPGDVPGAQRHIDGFRGTTPAEFRAWLREILQRRLASIQRSYFGTGKRDAVREVSLGSLGRQDVAGQKVQPARLPRPATTPSGRNRPPPSNGRSTRCRRSTAR